MRESDGKSGVRRWAGGEMRDERCVGRRKGEAELGGEGGEGRGPWREREEDVCIEGEELDEALGRNVACEGFE